MIWLAIALLLLTPPAICVLAFIYFRLELRRSRIQYLETLAEAKSHYDAMEGLARKYADRAITEMEKNSYVSAEEAAAYLETRLTYLDDEDWPDTIGK
jgi:DNA gyrase/topoisomerase IV subunit A